MSSSVVKAGAVIARYTWGGSWTRRSQDNRTDRCESAFTHSSSFPARWRPTLPVKDRQPVFGIVADLGADGIEQRHRFRGARENCQLVGETAKIELDDDSVMALLDQKPAGFRIQIVADGL